MDPPSQTQIKPGPSKLQLALALAIIKHKPLEKRVKGKWATMGLFLKPHMKSILPLTFVEYILEIRKFIKTYNHHELTPSDKFFDSVAFWQKAYKASEAEQTKLLNKVYELEQHNLSLRDRTIENSKPKHGSNTPIDKRKGCPEETLKNKEITKKRKPGRPRTQPSKDVEEEPEEPEQIQSGHGGMISHQFNPWVS